MWHDAAGGYDNGHELHVVFYRNRSTATKVMQRLAKRGWKMAEMYFSLPHHERTEGRKVALPKRKREAVAA